VSRKLSQDIFDVSFFIFSRRNHILESLRANLVSFYAYIISSFSWRGLFRYFCATPKKLDDSYIVRIMLPCFNYNVNMNALLIVGMKADKVKYL
jgi:hypothetical protein